ncbi:MAG: enoyl-CoA hydratase/isomerase family protein [Pseudomonadota bacterium]|nr:enoyl-CoA hydratase/isomerase family protein [Pseudomonadota bacterium]
MTPRPVTPRLVTPLRATTERDGQLVRLLLDRPKANVLDAELVGALRDAIRSLDRDGPIKLLVFEGAGSHFSFGASVPEHLPGQVRGMLAAFHALFREIEAVGVPTAAIVRGQCLGGGFELATACGHVVCDPTARFALPEITLGVFPPVAAATLSWRVPGAVVTRLVLSGEVVPGPEAVRIGLADACADDAEVAMQAWFDRVLAPRSAVALRFAWRAARRPMTRLLTDELAAVEALYLDELMACRDPVIGLDAFLAKTPPTWEHR